MKGAITAHKNGVADLNEIARGDNVTKAMLNRGIDVKNKNVHGYGWTGIQEKGKIWLLLEASTSRKKGQFMVQDFPNESKNGNCLCSVRCPHFRNQLRQKNGFTVFLARNWSIWAALTIHLFAYLAATNYFFQLALILTVISYST